MDTFTSIAIVSGSAFALVAAIGTLRFPDAIARMHAASKAGAFATAILLCGVVLHLQELAASIKAALVIALFYLTTPIATQALANATHRRKVRTNPTAAEAD